MSTNIRCHVDVYESRGGAVRVGEKAIEIFKKASI